MSNPSNERASSIQGRCAICAALLTAENDSVEHVIPNAVGGPLKVSGFICRSCNGKSGETWDAALASQLNWLCLTFDVMRDRGTTPPLPVTTTAGEHLVIKPEGGLAPLKPTYSEKQTANGVKISISARNLAEAKKMLSGVKRKFPQVDVDDVLSTAEISTTYPKGLIYQKLEIGGELAGRSLVKTALAFAHLAGGR